MSTLTAMPNAVAPVLQFRCGHCGTVLSVPAALAGIEGPCPACRRPIVAPSFAVPAFPLPEPPTPSPRATAPRLVSRAPVSPESHPPLPPTPRTLASAEPPRVRPPATEKRSSLRRRITLEIPPLPPENEISDLPAPRPHEPSAERGSSPRGNDPARRLWTWAGMGAVIGGGVVFCGLSALSLKRDLSAARTRPTPATSAAAPADDKDAVAALAAHQKASGQELRALLASQQAVWRFFAATNAEDARQLAIADDGAHPIPSEGVATPLTSVTLRHKRRVPDSTAVTSQWTVTTARFGELVVEVSDQTGQPKLNWGKLARQLGASSDRRTAATP